MHSASPSGRAPISIFGLAQTPGMPGMLSGFPGTPVSDAMTAASWLHDMSLRHPQQVPLLLGLCSDMQCDLSVEAKQGLLQYACLCTFFRAHGTYWLCDVPT